MAAYQAVFIEPELEGMCWEGRCARVLDLIRGRSPVREGSVGMALMSGLRYYDFFLICISCLVVYCILGELAPEQEWITVVLVVLTIVGPLVSVKSSSIAHSRKVWTEGWDRLKAEESRSLGRECR